MINSIILSMESMRGLGANLGHLSMLLHSNKEFNIYANERCRIFLDPIKESLGLDNIKIHDEDGLSDRVDHYPNMNDTDKFFAPYLDVKHVYYRGIHNPTGTLNKKFIAIACYQRSDPSEIIEDIDYQVNILSWPKNRYYSIDQYSKIFKLAKRAGYDVITFDCNEINFLEKIHIINLLCDCIIGYEGGLAHLGHVLKIPTIILPWQRNADGTMLDRSELGGIGFIYPWVLHLDKKTYFANSIDEILAWSPSQLKEIISQLHEDQGNNPILNPDFKFVIDKEYQKYQYSFNGFKSKILDLSNIVSTFSINFGRLHYDDMLIGGVKEVIKVNSFS